MFLRLLTVLFSMSVIPNHLFLLVKDLVPDYTTKYTGIPSVLHLLHYFVHLNPFPNNYFFRLIFSLGSI